MTILRVPPPKQPKQPKNLTASLRYWAQRRHSYIRVALSQLPTLPGISSWYNEAEDNESISDVDSISEAQMLQDLIDKAQDNTLTRPRKQADEPLNLTSAALALSADDMIKM
jgi:hypothetical protein